MAGKNGGARPGAGRKATGAKTKCYTVTLPLEEAIYLENRADRLGMSVNKYLRHIIQKSGQYRIVDMGNLYVDDNTDMKLAAEKVKPYDIDNPDGRNN